jgi:transposase
MLDASSRTRRHRRQCTTPISPIALDAIFDTERGVNRLSADERLRVRQDTSSPLVATLETWLRAERATLSRHIAIAKAIDYMLTRWRPSRTFRHCSHQAATLA